MNRQALNKNEGDLSMYPGRGLHWVALAAAVFTWPLLISGGEVTTYKVGMAVPDWPSTFGENMFLYDFWHASVGVFKEHLHRLLGATLGFAAIILAVWAVRFDPRRWMKVIGVCAFLAVCLQGLLGGSRVTRNSQTLAAFHACSGQAVFALLVAIVVWTGPRWWKATLETPDSLNLRRASFFTLGLIYLQIVLGACVRHFASPVSANVHALGATLVLGNVGWLIWRIERSRNQVAFLVPTARLMGTILSIQVLLGLIAFWILFPFDGTSGAVSALSALIRTGHQANGALLLASAVVMATKACRNLQANYRNRDALTESTPRNSDLEAVF